MNTVQQAKELIADNTLLQASICLPLEQALGKVLAADVQAPVSIPAFEHTPLTEGCPIRPLAGGASHPAMTKS